MCWPVNITQPPPFKSYINTVTVHYFGICKVSKCQNTLLLQVVPQIHGRNTSSNVKLIVTRIPSNSWTYLLRITDKLAARLIYLMETIMQQATLALPTLPDRGIGDSVVHVLHIHCSWWYILHLWFGLCTTVALHAWHCRLSVRPLIGLPVLFFDHTHTHTRTNPLISPHTWIQLIITPPLLKPQPVTCSVSGYPRSDPGFVCVSIQRISLPFLGVFLFVYLLPGLLIFPPWCIKSVRPWAVFDLLCTLPVTIQTLERHIFVVDFLRNCIWVLIAHNPSSEKVKYGVPNSCFPISLEKSTMLSWII